MGVKAEAAGEKRPHYDRWKLRPPEPLYQAAEHLDLTWYESELQAIREQWRNGVSVPEMAKTFKRRQEEVAILIMDQVLLNKLTKRPGGVWGSSKSTT